MNDAINQAMQDGETPRVIQADNVDAINAAYEQAEATNPPPGAARNDELQRRIDELEAQIERLAADREVYKIDPSVLQEDREILNKINHLNVSDPQPGRVYKWVYYGHQSFMVWKLKSLGWAVVQSTDPEAAELKDEQGYRKIGDTILMWIDEERFRDLEARAERLRRAQIDGVEAVLREMTRRYRDKGISLIEEPESDPRLKQRFAKQAANQKLDGMIREGTVPGMRVRK